MRNWKGGLIVSSASAVRHLGPFASARGTVTLPGSKSISNRMLLLAALAEGTTEVRNLLAAEDTAVMLRALEALGVRVEGTAGGGYRVAGCGGVFPVKQAALFLGNAGTAFRPLTAVLALQRGNYRLDGVARMRERPIGDLVDGLRPLGARIDYGGEPGFPPLAIAPMQDTGLETIRVRGDVSSQFLSALLMAAPLLDRVLTVEVEGTLISRPYVEITLATMAKFGVHAQRQGDARFHIAAGTRYCSPGTVEVEGDASSASYFLAAGALGGGPVRVIGAGRDSVQGDVRFAEALRAMGAAVEMGPNWIEVSHPGRARLKAIYADCNHIPDAAMTLAMLALAADGTSRLRNIASWRVKETDRIAAMATELRKLGAHVEEGPDFLAVTPPREGGLIAGAAIDTYDDHRMAMCFSLASLLGVTVTIRDPGCVAKTFPDYFDVLSGVIGR